MKPENPKLSLEFMGKTQMGEGLHRLEIMRLGYDSPFYKKGKRPTNGYYLIYFAGDKYGPKILQTIEGHTPYMKKLSADLIEIQFTEGNNGHMKQIWKLVGHTAELQEEKQLTWKERVYFKNKA